MWGLGAANRIIEAMERDAIPPAEAERLGEVPAEGIPRRVFEQASQARLLAKAQWSVERRPDRYTDDVQAILSAQERPRRGRPPVRSLADRLAILSAVEDMYEAGDGRTLADVADEHHMSRSSLRDLLSWARHSHDPPLFTSPGPGRSGGRLTPHGQALLTELEQED
jgi:hypothetical protein